MKTIPHHGPCFVCGSDNPKSIGVTWYLDEQDGSITTQLILDLAQQGPPGCAHGGALAALLDEAMGVAVWGAGHTVAAVHLDVDYRLPVPLGETVTVVVRITQHGEKKIITGGEIKLADGTQAVIGHGIYVEAPQLFGKLSFGK
jgi:acyl-coenzyme A thioesterase PaaI-like protein